MFVDEIKEEEVGVLSIVIVKLRVVDVGLEAGVVVVGRGARIVGGSKKGVGRVVGVLIIVLLGRVGLGPGARVVVVGHGARVVGGSKKGMVRVVGVLFVVG